jgi:hypothetical protein
MARARVSQRYDRVTGETVVLRSEVTDDNAGFGQRMTELRADLPDPGPGDVAFAAVNCDGCPASAILDFADPALPEGWTATPEGDFCPACSAALS